jgi:hypothetical protein
MAEVSVYVAVIAAGAAITGAAIPQVPVYVRDIRRAERDRRERIADVNRQACVELLSAAGDLLTAVANAGDYHGEEMAARLAEIRKLGAAVQPHAANIELLAPALAEAAAQVAAAAANFTDAAAENTSLRLNEMVTVPDPGELREATAAFRMLARTAAGH